ncbi:hypothetical protein [Leptolyngbya ohadii]|uniref:hypothetical protein n=1 Tax=Leptolyngbya ohadii TaxID=1962290 RepID=UPI00117A6C4C|nr:hypothetical protein [Leptolyngbya ohadii]
MAQSVAIASPPADRSVLVQSNSAQEEAAQLPPQVIRRVRRDLAQRFNVRRRDLRVVQFSQETWSDSCLGLAAPNERCAMALVDGWRIELSNGQQNWVYRTDRRAQVIKLETQDTATLPPQLVDRLFETIAREVNVPANTLSVLESQPRTWDGCMGIFVPERACTMIAISGYRVIVKGDRQSWVYHLDQEGTRIVQNTTASGSGNQITPSFMPSEEEAPRVPENIVFQMTVAGGLAGDTAQTVLTSDGVLYRRSTGLSASNPEPVIIKRLSQAQLQQFEQVLQQQQFPNLNGMRYLTSAALADYPTTVFQAMGSTVAYIDLEQDSLPQSLQTVIREWNQL